MSNHLVNHIKNPELCSDNTLHVIGVISNPARFNSRYRLFREWYERMLYTPNVKVYVVEIAFGDRQFECTDSKDPTHLQLRSAQEIWHKENMINLAVKRLLPLDWKYMCWSDCDISWPDFGWAKETIQQLQHYNVVQPWQNCLDLGFHGQVMQMFESFCYIHATKQRKQTCPGEPYKYAHSGFAWACTRYFWENIEKLMDWCIVGSADHHMAWGMINQIQYSVHGGMSESFKKLAHEWQKKAYSVTLGQLGYVKTRIEHHFHGKKVNRGYRSRWQMFIDHKFDPITDLSYDSQGLLKINSKYALLDDIRSYNRARQEDGIEEY